MVGFLVGWLVGSLVGAGVGFKVGWLVGFLVGEPVGDLVGLVVGFEVGLAVGEFVGLAVVGVAVGDSVTGKVGAGLIVGAFVPVGAGVKTIVSSFSSSTKTTCSPCSTL